MPVHRKKKDTTPTPLGSSQEQTAPTLPDQQTFHQYLRELACSAIRVVLEDVMREELDTLIGVRWGECSPKRKGYRNGSYTRDLVTSSGRLEEINVPRDREGHFHPQVFERYSCYEPHIAEGLTQMFVAGTSTQKVGEVAAFKAKYSQRYPEAVRSLTEEEEKTLTFYEFPQIMHRHIQTTNAIESLFSNVRQGTDQIDAFTTEMSCLAIVWAVMQDIHFHRIAVSYLAKEVLSCRYRVQQCSLLASPF